MKDNELKPLEMSDQELEVFVRSVLDGDRFNFDARSGEERIYNASIMERFNEYLPSDSLFSSCMVTSNKGYLIIQVLGVKSFNDSGRNVNWLEIDFTGWTTVDIIKTIINTSVLFRMMSLKSKYN